MKEESSKKIVKVFSIVSIVIGVFFVSYLSLASFFNFNYLYFSLVVSITILSFVGGVGLWKLKDWGRKLVLISVFVYIIGMIFSFGHSVYVIKSFSYTLQQFVEESFTAFFIAFAVCILYIYFFMFNKSVKKLFKSKSKEK